MSLTRWQSNIDTGGNDILSWHKMSSCIWLTISPKIVTKSWFLLFSSEQLTITLKYHWYGPERHWKCLLILLLPSTKICLQQCQAWDFRPLPLLLKNFSKLIILPIKASLLQNVPIISLKKNYLVNTTATFNALNNLTKLKRSIKISSNSRNKSVLNVKKATSTMNKHQQNHLLACLFNDL